MRQNERFKVDTTPKLFDAVELLSANPIAGLAAGAVGTIVETLSKNVYIVEFSDQDGRTIALETLSAHEIAAHR